MNHIEYSPGSPERLPRPASESGETDWRRLEVAAGRFADHIAEGIAKATELRTDIEEGTARCIAHVLGRGIGRTSALAEFGRTTTCDYDSMRDEYLSLYANPVAPAWLREQIDWLGTHLIRRIYPHSQTTEYQEQRPLTLDRLLVPTIVEIGGSSATVHVPGCYSGEVISDDLVPTLAEMRVDEDSALRAFLSLPDVNAMSGSIMEDFDEHYVGTYRSVDDAVHELADVDERERDVTEYANDRHLFFDAIQPDYEALSDVAKESYDLVEEGGRVYVFHK